jgi:hypothetical protein
MKGEASRAEADFAEVKSLEPMVELTSPQGASEQPTQQSPARDRGAYNRTGEKADGEHTKKAWESIEDIDIELSPLVNRDSDAYWEAVSTRYAKVNIDYVDTELQALIHARIDNATDIHALLVSYREAYRKIAQGVSDAENLGASLGAQLAKDDPRAGELCGAVISNLIGNAVADSKVKELNVKYAPKFESLLKRQIEADKLQKQLSDRLSKQYGIPFHQRARVGPNRPQPGG